MLKAKISSDLQYRLDYQLELEQRKNPNRDISQIVSEALEDYLRTRGPVCSIMREWRKNNTK